MKNETNAYIATVEYTDETKPMINDKFDTDGMEFVVFAQSYAEVETKVLKEVGDKFVKLYGIEQMEAVPLFD